MYKLAALGLSTIAAGAVLGFGVYSASAMQGPNAHNGATSTAAQRGAVTGTQQRMHQHTATMSDADRQAQREANQANCDGTGSQQHLRTHVNQS